MNIYFSIIQVCCLMNCNILIETFITILRIQRFTLMIKQKQFYLKRGSNKLLEQASSCHASHALKQRVVACRLLQRSRSRLTNLRSFTLRVVGPLDVLWNLQLESIVFGTKWKISHPCQFFTKLTTSFDDFSDSTMQAVETIDFDL